jgi:putative transposase
MTTRLGTNPYKRHRFPAEIICHCVWLYFRFCLSYRDVEELMAERGVILAYAAVRYWCRKFGQAPISCAAGVLDLAPRGIWMRCF